MFKLNLAAAVGLCLSLYGHSPVQGQVVADLQAALRKEDLSAVEAVVAAARQKLGARAGEPEVEDQYITVPKTGRWLSSDEAQPGFTKHLAQLERLATWRIGIDPHLMTEPLRAPASVMSGCVAVSAAKLEEAEKCARLAGKLADFLVWAQEQAGTGGFPFPLAQGTSAARAMQVATRFIERATKNGQLDRISRHGWIFDDLGDGGLQFDNGECGVAMFEVYELTHDCKYLISARQAADWAAAQPLCPNWNYNSFSVWLLAKACAVTGDPRYREAAWQKARLGVIPGQLPDGPRAGRWIDPHNARPPYHYIMLRSLAQLSAVLPEGGERQQVMHALALGLSARNAEMVTRGVMTKDKAMEALLLVHRLCDKPPSFLLETQSTTALDTLGRLVSEQARRGTNPLGPREWGLFLAAASQRAHWESAPEGENRR